MPMRVIRAGVVPINFAISVLQFPPTIAQFITVEWLRRYTGAIQPGQPVADALYFVAL